MARASKLEKLMLNLINAARDRAGLRDLQFDGNLNQAAEDHSEWMLRTDSFSHTGVGGSQPTERMREAGYRLTGTWMTGENIAIVASDGDGSLRDEVREAHRLLMNSSGHRANILKGGYQEIGLGIEFGKFAFREGIRDAVAVTQDFGRSSAPRQAKAEPLDLAMQSTSRSDFVDTGETSQTRLVGEATTRFTPFWHSDDFLF
jgi:serralysin